MTHQTTHTISNTRSLATFSTLALATAAPMAHAHHAMDGATPTNFFEGLLSGIAHPVIGLDHLAFLVVAALLSATLKGNSRYLVPLTFVLATVAGTLYHLGAASLPMTETVIALSVLLGGLAVAVMRNVPALLMVSMFGVIGVFHGYAYGESIIGAEQTPLLSYLAGFAAIQYVIIAGGVSMLTRLAARSEGLEARIARIGGGLAAAAGAVFLAAGLA